MSPLPWSVFLSTFRCVNCLFSTCLVIIPDLVFALTKSFAKLCLCNLPFILALESPKGSVLCGFKYFPFFYRLTHIRNLKSTKKLVGCLILLPRRTDLKAGGPFWSRSLSRLSSRQKSFSLLPMSPLPLPLRRPRDEITQDKA